MAQRQGASYSPSSPFAHSPAPIGLHGSPASATRRPALRSATSRPIGAFLTALALGCEHAARPRPPSALIDLPWPMTLFDPHSAERQARQRLMARPTSHAHGRRASFAPGPALGRASSRSSAPMARLTSHAHGRRASFGSFALGQASSPSEPHRPWASRVLAPAALRYGLGAHEAGGR